MNGESLHIAGRLLGHRRASTTNHCVHLDDATLSEASERAAMAIQEKFGGSVEDESFDVGKTRGEPMNALCSQHWRVPSYPLRHLAQHRPASEAGQLSVSESHLDFGAAEEIP